MSPQERKSFLLLLSQQSPGILSTWSQTNSYISKLLVNAPSQTFSTYGMHSTALIYEFKIPPLPTPFSPTIAPPPGPASYNCYLHLLNHERNFYGCVTPAYTHDILNLLRVVQKAISTSSLSLSAYQSFYFHVPRLERFFAVNSLRFVQIALIACHGDGSPPKLHHRGALGSVL